MTSGVDADGHRRVPSVHVRFEGGAAGGGAKDDGALIEPTEVAEAVMFALSRPRNVTIRDMIVLPSNFDI